MQEISSAWRRGDAIASQMSAAAAGAHPPPPGVRCQAQYFMTFPAAILRLRGYLLAHDRRSTSQGARCKCNAEASQTLLSAQPQDNNKENTNNQSYTVVCQRGCKIVADPASGRLPLSVTDPAHRIRQTPRERPLLAVIHVNGTTARKYAFRAFHRKRPLSVCCARTPLQGHVSPIHGYHRCHQLHID